jgi:hypothetical protein
MKNDTSLMLLAAATTCLVNVNCGKQQTTAQPRPDITVAADGSTDYETISEALDDASNGDVILVKPGTYEEEVEFESDQKNITLLGAGPGQAVIDADDEYAAVTLRGTGHRVSGFTVRGAESHGVYVVDGRHMVDRCLIVDNGDRGIYLSTMSGQGRAEIDHCTIVDNKVSGIYSVMDDAETAISNCIIAHNGRGVVTDKNEGGIKVTRSCLFNSGSNFDRVNENGNNVTKDPRFRDRSSGDYRLAKDSPCIGTGTNGTNMGCF